VGAAALGLSWRYGASAGLAPAYLAAWEVPVKTVFTIHNLAYAGIFNSRHIIELGLPQNMYGPYGFEFYGQMSYLKAGLYYADHITESMRLTMDETARRRAKQIAYNEANGITPQQIVKNSASAFPDKKDTTGAVAYVEADPMAAIPDPIEEVMGLEKLMELAEVKRSEMMAAAKELDFIEAARLRNELQRLEEKIRLLQ